MGGWSRFAAVTLLSVAVAFLLFAAARNAGVAGANDRAVFGYSSHTKLTGDNLVDRLADLPRTMKIRRVDWNSPVLAVDYTAVPGIRQVEIYRDLYTLSQFAVQGTSNVEEVQVRVYGSGMSAGSDPLLLSLNPRRSETGQLRQQAETISDLRTFLETRCRLTFTRKGYEQVGMPGTT